ncbi:hypothetical protein [Rhizobium multihospitium]|uniref:Uncharacterized protein n=1 Tax=Rhizobium multihospitium TaxID=410764 RepID=A0A1C3TX47_9HYPH|nr:hypothetical protein [Rhizobium multihospitium]SCB07705.1 hypothetical protein GA0061103_1123 [Rhizobium multihospitium]
MIHFFQRNMALFLASIMTVVAITVYNLSCLLLRHHHTMLHDLHHAAGALVLLAGFYTMIRYMQSLPDDEG